MREKFIRLRLGSSPAPASELSVWVLSGFLALLMAASAFPGWLSPDSLEMYRIQIGEEKPNGQFNELLGYFWGALNPAKYGGTGPLLIQLGVFWISVALLSAEIWKTNRALGLLLPGAVFVLDAVWVLGWIWQDSFVLAFGMLAYVLIVRSSIRGSRTALFCGIVCLALVGSIRPFEVFALLVVTLVAAHHEVENHRGPQGRQSVAWKRVFGHKWLGGTLLFAVVFGGSFGISVALVENPPPGGRVTQTLFFDLVRIECRNPGAVPELSRFAGEWDRNEVCRNFNTFSAHSVTRGFSSALRFPESFEEAKLVEKLWADQFAPHALLLAKDRTLLAIHLLRPSDHYIVPSYDLGNGQVDLAPPGRGAEVGFTPTGHAALYLSRLPSALLSLSQSLRDTFQLGFIYVLALPLVGLVRIYQRKNLPLPLASILAFFPILWGLGFAAVSPWDTTRYLSLAVVWGLAFFFTSFIEPKNLLRHKDRT